jgi:hypothetical protein
MDALPYHIRSEVVPRLQWNVNSGYCGETSMICAGLNFGQYCSQWMARKLASPYPQYLAENQLLLGTGQDTRAAVMMRLKASEYSSYVRVPSGDPGVPSREEELPSRELIVWAKSHLIQGHVPIIGVFNNVNTLQEGGVGDGQYDHIVPIVRWESNFPLEDGGVHYYESDYLTLSDNGLYGPESDGQYQFLYPYQVQDFLGDRQQANNPQNLYMLSNTPPNYGIAIEGVLDTHGVCIPVRLSCDRDREPYPPTMELSPFPPPALAQPPLCNQKPVPFPLRFTATVDLRGKSGYYNLYRYDDFANVPVEGFNAAATAGYPAQQWSILAGHDPTFVVEYGALSDETVVFRAVPASAP